MDMMQPSSVYSALCELHSARSVFAAGLKAFEASDKKGIAFRISFAEFGEMLKLAEDHLVDGMMNYESGKVADDSPKLVDDNGSAQGKAPPCPTGTKVECACVGKVVAWDWDCERGWTARVNFSYWNEGSHMLVSASDLSLPLSND